MAKLTYYTPVDYVVVCRTQRQATDLWRRLLAYWSGISDHFTITASKNPLMVERRFCGDKVRFVSVHSPAYIALGRGHRGKTAYFDEVDKFLDQKERPYAN